MRSGSDESYTPTMTDNRKKAIRWPHRLKKNLKNYLSTEVGLSVLIATISVVVITFLLSSRYLAIENLVTDEISNRDIVAEKTLQVEDPEETQHNRYEAKQLVAPIYRHEVGADKVVMDRLVDFLETIQDIRQNAKLGPDEKLKALQKLVDQRSVLVRPAVLNTLLATSNWQKIYDSSVDTAESLVTRGLTSEEFRDKREMMIRQSISPKSNLTPEETEAVAFLVETNLRPTMTIDEKSTEEARDIAASHIKPVIETYNKGDLIVKKADKITPLQKAALQKQGSISNKNRWLAVIGIAILCVSLLSIVWGYLYRFEHSNFFKPAYSSLLATAMVATVGGLALWMDLQPNFLPVEVYPIAILSLIICIFTHPRIAILTTMMILLLCGLTLKIPLDSLSVLVISSMVGIFVLARKAIPKDRNDLILAGFSVGVASAAVMLAISFIYEPTNGLEEMNLVSRLWLGVVVGIFSGIFTLGALPIVESWFKLVTPYTLLELGNHDRPMLRRMQLEAPGTFHHSVMVATLAEAAAEAIGANPILTRVGALYHDIGKVKRPLFFVENQAYFGVENPHDKLTPRLSKMVITAHPRDGIEMGKQLGLPKAIMRFMPEHHGTLVAGYFYNKAVLQEGEENVNKAQFRYPGPKPQSKETAIVMVADACESSVRALKNPTVQQVEERVDKIIKQRVDDGQFSECPVTFQDIQILRDTFIRILRGIQHNRIEYQQNVLEELGKKPAVENLRQASQSLRTIQDANTGIVQLPPPSGNGGAAATTEGATVGLAAVTADPKTELESLQAELEQEEGADPGCC